MELKIKILEISPNIKNIKINATDIISLSFMAENVVVKIDDIEKNITNKENILLILRAYSPNEKILFNLIRNEAIIIGTGKFTPLTGVKWYKIFDLKSITENNVNYTNKNLSKKNKNNDSLISSNIKIKLETQVNILNNYSKSKSKSKVTKINNSNNKKQVNINNLINFDEKSNNSIISSNISSNFNQFKLNQKINSYTATPGIKSPRYTNLLMRAQTNKTNNNNNNNENNNSSEENTMKENNILPALDLEKEKAKKNSSGRTTSGKKFLCQTQKYKTLYGFNKSKTSNKNKSTEKSLENNINLINNRGKMSKEIEEKILDKNFQDIIKCDEILRGKEITDFNSEGNNIFNNQENNNMNNENINNNNNNTYNAKKSINTKVKNISNNKDKTNIIIKSKNKKNKNINNNENNIKVINPNKKISNENIVNSNVLNSNNLKSDLNNLIQNSAVSSALSSKGIMNIGGDIDLSDELSGSFLAYDNISKILDDHILTYDIENEDIAKYENIKNDFILFYNKDYINSINEEMFILELQLMIDKTLEMQNVYKKESMIIQKNMEKFRKKMQFFQKKNLLMNKKKNKLIYLQLKNKYKEEMHDLYYNNKKISFYKNKDIFRANELSLWNNLTSYIIEKKEKSQKGIDNMRGKFKNIFLIICNKNINNLNTLSKKFVLEFVEKEKMKEKQKEKEKEKEKEKKKEKEQEKDKEKEIEKKNEKVRLNNTYNNFYNEHKRKNEMMSNLKNSKINAKNSVKNYFYDKNKNDIIGNKSNKLLKSNDAVFKRDNKKEMSQIQETEGGENRISNHEKIKKIKFNSNDFGQFNNRNYLNKKSFNTMKNYSKKFNNKK